jgi:hypothetical protein
MLPTVGLISFWLGCGIYRLVLLKAFGRLFAETVLNAVVNREIYGPCREIAQYCRSEATV